MIRALALNIRAVLRVKRHRLQALLSKFFQRRRLPQASLMILRQRKNPSTPKGKKARPKHPRITRRAIPHVRNGSSATPHPPKFKAELPKTARRKKNEQRTRSALNDGGMGVAEDPFRTWMNDVPTWNRQLRTKRSGAERSRAERSDSSERRRAERSGANRSGAEPSGAERREAERSGTERNTLSYSMSV